MRWICQGYRCESVSYLQLLFKGFCSLIRTTLNILIVSGKKTCLHGDWVLCVEMLTVWETYISTTHKDRFVKHGVLRKNTSTYKNELLKHGKLIFFCEYLILS